MNIKLTEKYYLTSDKLNYILQERQIIKKGERIGAETFVPFAYFGNFKHLANTILELEIRESDITELKEIKDLLIKIETEINDNICHLKIFTKP